jgi:hypothetical protein
MPVNEVPDEDMDIDEPVFVGEGIVKAMPHPTSSALDIRCVIDSADERLAELVLRGRYVVTLSPIED